MLTLLAYSWYREKPKISSYVLVALSLTLGLLAKPMLVTLPLVLLLLDYWPLDRARLFELRTLSSDFRSSSLGLRTATEGRSWNISNLIIEKLPLFLLVLASCIITFIAQHSGKAIGSLADLPLGVRIQNALVSYVRYPVATVWPRGLAPFYPHPEATIPLWKTVGASTLLAGSLLLGFRSARRFPYLVTGLLWYLGTLVPVIGLVQVGGQSWADRYSYIPLIGLFIAVAWGLADVAARLSLERVVVPVVCLVLAACLVGTWRQASFWRNSIAL
jgi:hypothetical protein